LQEPRSPPAATQDAPQCTKVLSSHLDEDSDVESNSAANGDDKSDDEAPSHADTGTMVSQKRLLPV